MLRIILIKIFEWDNHHLKNSLEYPNTNSERKIFFIIIGTNEMSMSCETKKNRQTYK